MEIFPKSQTFGLSGGPVVFNGVPTPREEDNIQAAWWRHSTHNV